MIQDTGERLIPELHKHSLTYGEHLSRYLSVTEIVKGKKVLDVACGVGYGTQLLAKTAKEVDGADISEEAINYAKEHYQAKNVTFTVSDATALPYKTGEFDVVVSFETIEHITNQVAFVKEVRRVLKPGGVFVVSTPNDDEFMEGNEFHVHEFDLAEMKKVVGKAFKNSQLYFQGTWFAAGVFDQSVFEQGGHLTTDVVQMYQQNKEKAIFYIAVCSDADVPVLRQPVALADRWSSKEDFERDNVRQGRYSELEQQYQQAQTDTVRLSAELEQLRKRLETVHGSLPFRIINKIFRIDR